MIIKRHIINRDVDSEFKSAMNKFEKFYQKVRSNLKKNKVVNLWAFKDLGLRLTIYAIVTNDVITAKKGLTCYAESGRAHLQKEYCTSSLLRIKLENEVFEIESGNNRSGIGLFDWWKLFNAALILRHEEFKNDMYDLLDYCINESKDPFWRRFMDLVLMCNGKKVFEPSVLSDIKSIVSSGFVAYHGMEVSGLLKSEDGKNIREKMWLPVAELYYLAYQNNEDAFNKLLEDYLIKKKDWIIKNNEEDNSSYWVDFPLLACCTYAYDKNIAIMIESDYIPSNVYKGEINS